MFTDSRPLDFLESTLFLDLYFCTFERFLRFMNDSRAFCVGRMSQMNLKYSYAKLKLPFWKNPTNVSVKDSSLLMPGRMNSCMHARSQANAMKFHDIEAELTKSNEASHKLYP